MPKVCLLMVANDFLEKFAQLIPSTIRIVDTRQCFDRAATVVKIVGDALPDWCEVPAHGGAYPWASATFDNDGWMRLTQVPQESNLTYTRILEQSPGHN